VIEDSTEKTWIRADAGGIVDMHFERGALVHEGDRICTITNPFKDDNVGVEAPFTGLLVGVLENPVVYPGNPICHLVELEDDIRRIVEREQSPTTDGGT
jgi:predicted deacylase